jgi:myo-inositol-1(or 4)-monophosphatase
LAYVASGGFEADIQLGLHSYDFAAGVILAQEAGGKITALDGDPYIFPDNYFIASNGVFHDMLVSEVKKQKEKLKIVV